MRPTLTSLAKEMAELKTKVEVISAQLPEPPKSSRFIDNKDGTITDKETSLTWMKEDDGKTRTWSEAKEYAEGNKMKLPGKGWRLPTVKELISLVDYEKYDPAIDPVFTNTKSSYYWSSTRHASYSDGAWSVDFSGGYVYWYFTNLKYCVRPVRQNS